MGSAQAAKPDYYYNSRYMLGYCNLGIHMRVQGPVNICIQEIMGQDPLPSISCGRHCGALLDLIGGIWAPTSSQIKK